MTNPTNKGRSTSPDDPGGSKLMAWIADHRDYDKDYCLIWPFSRMDGGYGTFFRHGTSHYVHRYMCEYANGPAPADKPEASHSCGRGHDGCVNPRHLSWKSTAENQIDRRLHGTALVGRLSPMQVDEIRASTEPAYVIAKRFGLSVSGVKQVRSHTIKRTSAKQYRYLTDDQRAALMEEIEAPIKYLSEKYNICRSSIYRLKHLNADPH